jgi:hypothetical protein
LNAVTHLHWQRRNTSCLILDSDDEKLIPQKRTKSGRQASDSNEDDYKSIQSSSKGKKKAKLTTKKNRAQIPTSDIEGVVSTVVSSARESEEGSGESEVDKED